MRSLWTQLWIDHTIMSLVGSKSDSDSNGAPEQIIQGHCKRACSGVEETQYYGCVHMIIQHVMLWFNGTTLNSWTCYFYEKKFHENMYSHILFMQHVKCSQNEQETFLPPPDQVLTVHPHRCHTPTTYVSPMVGFPKQHYSTNISPS